MSVIPISVRFGLCAYRKSSPVPSSFTVASASRSSYTATQVCWVTSPLEHYGGHSLALSKSKPVKKHRRTAVHVKALSCLLRRTLVVQFSSNWFGNKILCLRTTVGAAFVCSLSAGFFSGFRSCIQCPSIFTLAGCKGSYLATLCD